MTTQMTTGQARVIDPVLTNVARGYQNAEFVGTDLFPRVSVPARAGKIITFGKEDFALYNTGRSPGAATKRVQFGHASGSYALEQHALEGVVPWELMQEAERVPSIDMGAGAVRKTQNIIGLRLEKAQADLATDPTKYAAGNKLTSLTGTTLWSNSASDPIGNVETAKEAVRTQSGRRPNTCVLSALTFKALRTHPQIIDRIKYTGRDAPTPDLLAMLFGVERVLVGDGIYADASGAFVDLWGKTCVLAYTATASAAELGVPSYGYTYTLEGAPYVEPAYQDRNAKSWVYPVTDEVQPVIAGAEAGYLISPAVA